MYVCMYIYIYIQKLPLSLARSLSSLSLSLYVSLYLSLSLSLSSLSLALFFSLVVEETIRRKVWMQRALVLAGPSYRTAAWRICPDQLSLSCTVVLPPITAKLCPATSHNQPPPNTLRS